MQHSYPVLNCDMRYIVAIILMLSVANAGEYRGTVLDVHDGDTVTARIELGFNVSIVAQLRLKDVYAPELREEHGQDCRFKLLELLPTNSNVFITTFETKKGTAIKTFDRYVAVVSLGREPINSQMIKWLEQKKLTGGAGL